VNSRKTSERPGIPCRLLLAHGLLALFLLSLGCAGDDDEIVVPPTIGAQTVEAAPDSTSGAPEVGIGEEPDRVPWQTGDREIDGLLVRMDSDDVDERKKAREELTRSEPNRILSIAALLSREDRETKMLALQALYFSGKSALPAVPALLPLLEDSDPRLRRSLAHVLSSIGEGALEPLLETRDDPDRRVRRVTLRAIEKLGPEALPRLLNILEKGSPLAQAGAASALLKVGSLPEESFPLIKKRAREGSRECRLRCISLLGKFGEGARPVLLEGLVSPDSQVRRGCVESLGTAGQGSPRCVEALRDVLGDSDAKVRKAAIRALGKIGGGDSGVIRELIALLEHQAHDNLDNGASDSIRALGDMGAPAAPHLVRALFDSEWELRYPRGRTSPFMTRNLEAAIRAIGEPAVPLLIERLGGEALHKRPKAAKLILAIGPSPDALPVAIRALLEAGRDRNNWGDMAGICKALGEDAVKPLIGAFENGSRDQRVRLLCTLALLGEKGIGAIPFYLEQVRSSDPWIREIAGRGLGQVGDKAMPFILEALAGPDRLSRLGAVRALGQNEKRADEIIPLLTNRIESDPDPEVRNVAITYLGQFGEKSSVAVPALVKAVDDDATCKKAIEALGHIGCDAERALPVLEALIFDPAHPYRFHALNALNGFIPGSFPLLERILDRGDIDMRKSALRLIGGLGKKARPLAGVVIATLTDDRLTGFRRGNYHLAVNALARIHLDRNAVPTLVEMMQDESLSDRARIDAVRVLGQMGKEAESALPFLETAPPVTKRAARSAMERIREEMRRE
jgi:HEAT repeat protein